MPFFLLRRGLGRRRKDSFQISQAGEDPRILYIIAHKLEWFLSVPIFYIQHCSIVVESLSLESPVVLLVQFKAGPRGRREEGVTGLGITSPPSELQNHHKLSFSDVSVKRRTTVSCRLRSSLDAWLGLAPTAASILYPHYLKRRHIAKLSDSCSHMPCPP